LSATAARRCFYGNGDEKFPNLKTEQVFKDENPPTHEQGSERPGRVSKALESSQRSAVEPVDWHQIEEHRFAKKVAAAMEQVVRERRVPTLVVPLAEIERHLTSAP
jgi:protein required for attachment to host cells